MWRLTWGVAAILCWMANGSVGVAEPLRFEQGDKVVLIGNTLAERMQEFNHFETLLHAAFPEQRLTVRNLGWSGDTITTRLRSMDFQDHGHTLVDHAPNVILAFFGFNESFAGEAGLEPFRQNLRTFLADLQQLRYPSENYDRGSFTPRLQDKEAGQVVAPRIVLISPIANEDLPERNIFAGTRNNENLRLYSEAMQEVALESGVPFIDLYTPTASLPAGVSITENGCHLSNAGDAFVAHLLAKAMLGEETPTGTPDEAVNAFNSPLLQSIQAAVAEKNRQFFRDLRAVNGYYIYGGRKEPYGVVHFPAEFAKLRSMTALRDERIWQAAQVQPLPAKIDDSATGDLVTIETNVQREIVITSPEEALRQFVLADDFEINLWASEVEFPDLANPVAFTFDARGRLWVTTMPSYPMPLPGEDADDKVLILEDTNGDGQADVQTVFAAGLQLPTGIELGDQGAYVSQQPNLLFLKDTDGDDVADDVRIRLHGFDSADSHHAISAFEWGPGGELYMLEGTFHHSQIETADGVRRAANGAVYRYEPRPEKLDVFVAYNFNNPWGLCFDRWGQNFVADASDGANYFAAAFSGDLDFPRQHPAMPHFLTRQWRPTCGNELVSSRHFPAEMQGDYLLNNCIGFQGILRYRMREEGSGFAADPAPPLMRSEDPNFRPVDLQFGPDGALYVLDWFNPLIGHMQHSLRDPNRDVRHGRIWRITYKHNPLVTPAVIADQPVDVLLSMLDAPEDRMIYRVRRELRDRETAEVVTAVDHWIEGLSNAQTTDERLLLEGLWMKQQHDVVDEELLRRLLNAQDPRVRAASVRVLCYWRDRVPDPLELLQTAVNDEHPRVRLEAVRALSFFSGQQAIDIATEALLHDQDAPLEYVLNEALETLERRGGPEE